MSHALRIAFFLSACLTAASAKGITVRFLPNPPEDSIVAYAVLRADGAGAAPVKVGEVPAAPARDTFAFDDSGAARGRAYVYSIVGMDAAGNASDPSDSTEIALPALAMPDTLRAANWVLPAGADPLSGAASLSIVLEDTSRFSMRYDSAGRALVFDAKGDARSGWVVVRASYYGKFLDRDSVWLSFATTRAAVPAIPGAGASYRVPASWSFARQGAMPLRASPDAGARGRAAQGRIAIVTARGEAVADLDLPGNGSEVLWDGKDAHGRIVKPACYLWAARGSRGALLQAGRLRLDP